MRLLFDHNVPKGLRRYLSGHIINTTREMKWDRLQNGDLLQEAAGAFSAFLSIDKKLQYEQNLKLLPLPVIVLDSVSNALPIVAQFAPFILELLKSPLENALYLIAPDGAVRRFDGSTPNP